MRITLTVAAAFLAATPLSAAAPILGKWLTQSGKGSVDIMQCGAVVCGKIAKVTVTTNGPPLDRQNPDASLRTRPLLGLPILIGLKDTGKVWEGSVYDAEHGKTYRAYVSRNANGTLSMKGCLGGSFFCKTQTWTLLR
jgi:uncharacterized protein (DUF2147 family)